VPDLVDENLGKVACPVCGTEYDDNAPSCPKCGSMSLASKKALIKGEGRPVPLRVSEPAAPPPPRMTPLGLAPAQGGYPPQNQLFIRPRQQEDPMMLWMGITGIFLGMGGMMIGMLWMILPSAICQVLAFSLDFAAIGIGIVALKKGSKIAIGSLVIGIMALFITILLAGIFWMVGI
jgi:hypothetical protein